MAAVSANQVLNASSFSGSSSSSFSTNSSGVIYIGFKTTGGNVGWFRLDLGGAVTYGTIGGQYGNAGESVTVGASSSTVPGLGGLAALAIGAAGLRS